MKITPFGLQLMNFEQTGQLLAVPKEALDEDPQDLLERVDYCFKATRDEDNDWRDYSPLDRDIFKWSGGQTTAAYFHEEKGERSLDRIDKLYRRSENIQVRQTPEVVQIFHSISYKGEWDWIRCYRIDQQNPEQSFLQDVTLHELPVSPRLSSDQVAQEVGQTADGS